MRLFELTGPEREGIEAQVKQINDYFKVNVAPAKAKVDDYYVQQWPKPYWVAYSKSVEQLTKLYAYMAHDIMVYTQERQKTEPNYKFPVVVIDTLKKTLASHVKASVVKPKDIHMAKHSGELRYKGQSTEPHNDLEKVTGEIKRLITDLKNSLNAPKKPPGGRKKPPIDTPPVEPEQNKPGTDISTNVKLKQLGYDDTVKGEFIPGEKPDRTKLDKYGEIINGEWTVVNDAMKQLPDLTPKQLVDMRPKAGDYVMWTGGARSSRPGEDNYGKITGIRPNGVLQVTSVNQQPNPSRQGRAFGLNPKSVTKYLSKTDMQQSMPQRDPKKYRKPGGPATTINPGSGAQASAVQNAIQKGMQDVKKLRNLK